MGLLANVDTLQPDLMPLPDRAAQRRGRDSAGLIGKTMPNGTVITKDNLDAWISPQLPPQGKRNNTRTPRSGTGKSTPPTRPSPLYLEGAGGHDRNWPDFTKGRAQDTSGRDRATCSSANRPEILFDPTTGRPAFPMLRTHVGVRPPFSPNGHTGAPWLGEHADATRPIGVMPTVCRVPRTASAR